MATKEVKAGLGYTIGNICIKGITFITLPIFSNLLSTSDFGIYNTYVTYEAIISIILGVGMYSSIKNAMFDFQDKIDKYVSTMIYLILSITTFILGIAIIFNRIIQALVDFNFVVIILLVLHSAGTALLNVENVKLSLNYQYKKYLMFATFNTIISVGLSVMLIIFIFCDNRSMGRIIGASVPMIIIGTYIVVSELKKGSFSFDFQMAKYALLFGIPLIWHYLSQQVTSQFDRIMITKIVGASSTGIYSLAYTIANILQIIFYSTDNVWGVWLFKQMDERNYLLIKEKSKKYIGFILLIASMMIICSKEIIMVMSNPSYWEGADVFFPIILGLFLLFLYSFPVSIEYYFKKTKYIAVTTLVAAIVNIITNYIFIPLYGYVAAAYTTAFSYFVMFIMHWIIATMIMKKEKIDEIFDTRYFLVSFVILSIIGIFTDWMKNVMVVRYIFVFVIISFYAIYYRVYVANFLEKICRRKG